MSSSPPLFLASRSPRRRELLAAWGWPARLVSPGPERGASREGPAAEVLARARAKCLGAELPAGLSGLVLAADTLGVGPGGEWLGKPADRAEAARFLRLLSGRRHRVLTAVWGRLVGGDEGIGGIDRSEVEFRPLGDRRITAYLETERWRDRAAAYGLQDPDWPFVARVRGEEETVIGLPRGLTGWILDRLAREWPAG